MSPYQKEAKCNLLKAFMFNMFNLVKIFQDFHLPEPAQPCEIGGFFVYTDEPVFSNE